MKRVIKFRAWNTDYSPPLMEYFDLIEQIKDIDKNRLFKYYDKILMQFTGLKDKNGKEIYEGDIVAFPKHGWEEDRFIDKIYWSNRAGGWNINSILAPTSEVIGNIYESPHLLLDSWIFNNDLK